MYKIAGAAAFVAFLANVLDVILGLGDTDLSRSGSRTAVEWFGVFGESGLRGLYLLGILNIVYMTSMIPLYLGLFLAQRHSNGLAAALAASVGFTGMAIYIANSAAIPMYALAVKFALAQTDAQRVLIGAAGEAVLARGEDFTPGAFPGLMLSGAGAVMMSFVMLRGGVFSKTTAWVGIVGFTSLCIFTIWATFVPVLYAVAFYGFGMIGGILALTWFVQVARRFFELGRGHAPA